MNKVAGIWGPIHPLLELVTDPGQREGVCSCALAVRGGGRDPCNIPSILSSSELGFLLNELHCLQPLPAAPFSLVSPAAHPGLSPSRKGGTIRQWYLDWDGEGKPCWEAPDFGPRQGQARQGERKGLTRRDRKTSWARNKEIWL